MVDGQNGWCIRGLLLCRCLQRFCEIVAGQNKRLRTDYESVIWIHLVTKEQQINDNGMRRDDYNVAHKLKRE